MIWIIDDITNLLSKVDINQIFENYLKEKKGEDPVIYFYETFLSEYDPKEREKREYIIHLILLCLLSLNL